MSTVRRLLNRLILGYSIWAPYHPGKWRVVNALVCASGVDALNRGRTVLVRRRGIRWLLSTDCWVQRTVFYHGEWDGNEVRELLARFPADGVFFDVGAYFGYYSLVVAHHTRGRATVHAFEPLRANHALLRENCRLNAFERIHAHAFALSDSTRTAEMELPPSTNGGSGHLLEGQGAGRGRQTVRLTTLDRFIGDNPTERLDFLKIDVEGAELAVLRGARQTLARFRPRLLVELNPAALRAAGSEPDDLLSLLHDFGYHVAEVAPKGLVPFCAADLAQRPDLRDGYTNLFCEATL